MAEIAWGSTVIVKGKVRPPHADRIDPSESSRPSADGPALTRSRGGSVRSEEPVDRTLRHLVDASVSQHPRAQPELERGHRPLATVQRLFADVLGQGRSSASLGASTISITSREVDRLDRID